MICVFLKIRPSILLNCGRILIPVECQKQRIIISAWKTASKRERDSLPRLMYDIGNHFGSSPGELKVPCRPSPTLLDWAETAAST
jgi:hypothetical protein